MKKILIRFFYDKIRKEKCGKIDGAQISRKLRYFFRKMQMPEEINIVFVNDLIIKKLNKQYRGANKVSDVLSFNYNENEKPGDENGIGEIYINVDFLIRASKKLGVSIEPLIKRRIAHGILHLAGYDHGNLKEKEKMEQLEKRLLEKIG